MSHFKIERVASNGVSELNRPSLYPLPQLQSQILVQQLGVTASYSDNGMHSWYGNVSLGSIARPFLLSIDRVGNATLSIDDRGAERLMPLAMVSIEPHLGDCLVAYII